MEGTETVSSSGVTVVKADAPSDYHVAPRTENQPQPERSNPPPPAPPQSAESAAAAAATMPVKKKRGRPRKYGPDGALAVALSPRPISSSAPPAVIDFSAAKRGKVRPVGLVSRNKYEMDNTGNTKNLCPF